MKAMPLGHIVDYCTEYINRRLAALPDTDKKGKPVEKRRKATQADWDNFWG